MIVLPRFSWQNYHFFNIRFLALDKHFSQENRGLER